MTAILCDVNVLTALLDPTHAHHDRAHEWFAGDPSRDWITVPLTENGVLRIVSHPSYSIGAQLATFDRRMTGGVGVLQIP